MELNPIEITSPSSSDNHNLVIDQEFPLSNSISPPSNSASSLPEDFLPKYLSWPLLLQQVAMQKLSQYSQNSLTDSSESKHTYSSSAIDFGNSSRVDQSGQSKNMYSQSFINCDECGKKFRGSNLHIHKRRVHHLLQEAIKCCGEDFPTRWHLSLHRKSGDHLPTLWNEGSVKEAKSLITMKLYHKTAT